MRRLINDVAHGDCIDVMRALPWASVDFILTDPPYLVNYRDRSGRSLANDDNDAWLKPAFRAMNRVLRPDRQDGERFQIPHALELNEIRFAIQRTSVFQQWTPEPLLRVLSLSPAIRTPRSTTASRC